MPKIPTFEEYVASLGQLTVWTDPTIETPESTDIKNAAASLNILDEINVETLAAWAYDHPKWVRILGLAAGLSQEKLKNLLNHRFRSMSWSLLARTQPVDLISVLDEECHLSRLVSEQRFRTYDFGDVLAARAGTRRNAVAGANAGRALEDMIEEIAKDLGLPYELRTRFIGRHNQDGPCDLVIPTGKKAVIAVAAKAFGSTGSKLTAAFGEIEKMADVRKPSQFIMAVIDGLGWKGRRGDLTRLYNLWVNGDIDGMYTVATLGQFRIDLEEAARRHKLL